MSLGVNAQQKLKMQKNKVLIIFDGSNSMNNQWEMKTKLASTREQLFLFLDKCSKYGELEFALRVFGHQFPNQVENCNDTKLEVNFTFESIARIKNILNKLKPQGTSPIEGSLARVENDYMDNVLDKRTVILFADGTDACNTKICTTYQDMMNSSRYENIFVVGIDIDEEFAQDYKCISSFRNAVHEQDLKPILDSIFVAIKPY